MSKDSTVEYLGWWDDEDRTGNPSPITKMYLMVGKVDKIRPANVRDLFEAGFTPREMSMEDIKAKNKIIRKLKDRKEEIVDVLYDLITALNSAREEGYSFEEFSDPEGVEEAIEQAIEVLHKEGRDI